MSAHTDALRALAEAATERPWEEGCGFGAWHITTEGDDCDTIASTPYAADAALIVALVNRAEKLLAVVEAAEAVLAAPPHRADHGQYCARCVIEGDLLDALAALEAEA